MIRFSIGGIFTASQDTRAFTKGERLELLSYARDPKTGDILGYFASCSTGHKQILSVKDIEEIQQ